MTGRVLLDVSDGVAVITLDNADAKNSLTDNMARAMVAHCEAIDSSADVGAVILRGAQGQFCAGAHRSVLAEIGSAPSSPENYDALGRLYQAFHRFGQLRPPTIAAIRGDVVGAGMNLMLAADLRLVATSARIQSGFLRIGLHPGGGHFSLLSRAASPQTAAAMALFSEVIDGTRAVETGIAWQAFHDDDVEKEAHRLATRASKDPELSRLACESFRITNHQLGLPWSAAIATERGPQLRSLHGYSSDR